MTRIINPDEHCRVSADIRKHGLSSSEDSGGPTAEELMFSYLESETELADLLEASWEDFYPMLRTMLNQYPNGDYLDSAYDICKLLHDKAYVWAKDDLEY